MQSIAKQLTLAPTATHKTVKTQGFTAVTLARRLKRRLNRGENKATVQIRAKAVKICAAGNSGITNKNVVATRRATGQPVYGDPPLVACLLEGNFILRVCGLDRGSCRKVRIYSPFLATVLLFLLQCSGVNILSMLKYHRRC